MKPLRTRLVLGSVALLLGGACTFGRPIVDEEKSRFYPTDGVLSCKGTRCADLPNYELALPPPLDDSPCAKDLPTVELATAARTGSSLVGMRYVLDSKLPSELKLDALDLHDACLVLSGPVRLTLGAGSMLTHVTVLFGSDTSKLDLSGAALDRVALRAADKTKPSGSAQIEFSNCLQCETHLASLTVTESNMMNSRLGAGTLNLVGGAFDTVELSFEHGLLAGVLANNLRTAACNSLSLTGAVIAGRASQIGPCECSRPSAADAGDSDAGVSDAGDSDAGESDAGDSDAGDAGEPDADVSDGGDPDAGDPDAGVSDAGDHDADKSEAGDPDAGVPDASRPDAGPVGATCKGATISQTVFFSGMVDGKVHAENSSFASVLFARHAPTSLDMWNGKIELGVICDHPMAVRLDKNAGIGCVSCDSAQTATACALSFEPKLVLNTCKAFRGKLSACPPPLPIMNSPFTPKPPKKGD